MKRILTADPFLGLAVLVIIFESLHIIQGEWGADFWEHAAVVKTLSANFFHPSNPILQSEVPHAFYSPYSLLVAAFAKLTQIGPVPALEYFSFFNLLFLLYSFHAFCNALFTNKLIAVIGFLLILFFMGMEPFRWSGFFHVIVLHYVLAYPSTFAFSLSLLVLSILTKKPFYGSAGKITGIVLLCTLIFICHPTTGVFLYIAVFSLALTADEKVKSNVVLALLIIVLSFLLSLLWPYFSMGRLVFGEHADFEKDSSLLYIHLLKKSWPVLLGIPAALLARKNRAIRFLIVCMACMLFVCTLGWLCKIYGLGRLLSDIMMFNHLLLAFVVLQIRRERTVYARLYLWLLSAAFVFSVYTNRLALSETLDVTGKKDTAYYKKFEFLKAYIRPEETVLSDMRSNFFIPAYSGKVVASKFPVYWIADMEQRRADILAFFAPGTPDIIRENILQKYRSPFVLIDQMQVQLFPTTLAWLQTKGTTVYNRDSLQLIRMRP